MFSTLLIGPPGSGKTTVACTAPKPILFLDVDNKLHKMENIQHLLESKEVVQWAMKERLFKGTLTSFVEGATKPLAKLTQQRAGGYLELVKMVDTLERDNCTYEGRHYATIVLDSYTTLEEHLKRLLMSVNGVVTISLPLFGTVLTNYENLNNALLSLKANIIFICHEQGNKDDITGAISYTPLISGQMKNKIGKDFEEVYYMEKSISGGTASYKMLTVGTSMKSCRTSRVLDAKAEPDFSKIYKS